MRYIVPLLIALISPALAEAPRQINFTLVLAGPDNKVMKECADDPAPKKDEECKSWQPVTLGMIVLRAMSAPEQGLAPDVSLKRGQLGLRAYKAESLVLTSDEITIIKNQIAKTFSPLIVAITFPMLDPATADK